jgi:hypothetical protein
MKHEKLDLSVWSPQAVGLFSSKFDRGNQKPGRRLTVEEMTALFQPSALPKYPGRMLATQTADRFGPVDLWGEKLRT